MDLHLGSQKSAIDYSKLGQADEGGEDDFYKRVDFEYGVVDSGTMFPDLSSSSSSEPLFLKTVPEATVAPPVPVVTRGGGESSIHELSILGLSRRVASNLLNLMDDLVSGKGTGDWKDRLRDIFTKEDRIFSVGVLLIFVSIFIVFFTSA